MASIVPGNGTKSMHDKIEHDHKPFDEWMYDYMEDLASKNITRNDYTYYWVSSSLDYFTDNLHCNFQKR